MANKSSGAVVDPRDSTVTDFNLEKLAKIQKKYGVRVPETLDIGGIVGIVDVTDCVRNHPSPWLIRGNWGWVLKNPRRLPYHECKAVVGFFIPDF